MWRKPDLHPVTKVITVAVCISLHQEAEIQSEPFLSEYVLAECGLELRADGILSGL